MQILIAQAAHQRIAAQLAAMAADFDVLTLDVDKVVKRDGKPVAAGEVDPEVFWLSRDIFWAGLSPTYWDRILKGPGAKWAQLSMAGVDDPVYAKIVGKGVAISKSSAQAPAIAEYVMCQALSLLHPIAETSAAQAAHRWERIEFREIGSTRWLMVGFGAIGREIAKRLQPFGAPLTVVRRNLAPEPMAADVRSSADLLGLLPQADVVVLACALTRETRGMADAAFFAAMKPGSLLINIARGGLVDEAQLRAGLDRGQPGFAVLDVLETEPPKSNAWVWDHPKVRLTAHCSNAGDGVWGRGDQLFLENLRRYRAGEPLLNRVQPADVGL